jgi:hypothetical protein
MEHYVFWSFEFVSDYEFRVFSYGPLDLFRASCFGFVTLQCSYHASADSWRRFESHGELKTKFLDEFADKSNGSSKW